jgi:cob(I)alamin adenosyltransferase
MPKTTKLYTGAGDEGYTGLLGQERVAKYDLRPAAYGVVDEASAFLGLARADASASERTRQLIMAVQRDLWLLMGELAAAPGVELPCRLTADRVTWLEAETDRLGAEFPPLREFVLPGDTEISARLDVARTVVRRAERDAVKLLHERLLNNKDIIRYLNRLSSLLFALARYEDHQAGRQSTPARPPTD